MLEINEHILKITGSASLMEPLEFQHNYKVIIEGEVRGGDPRPNDDGTKNVIYPLRMLTAEVIKDNGEVVKTKDKRKLSQKLRGSIYYYMTENYPDENEEEFYNKAMGLAIKHIDRWLPYLIKEDQ